MTTFRSFAPSSMSGDFDKKLLSSTAPEFVPQLSGDFDKKNLSSAAAEFVPSWLQISSDCDGAKSMNMNAYSSGASTCSQDDTGFSTDAGEDIVPIYVDFDSYDSYSETETDCCSTKSPKSPRADPASISIPTCIYSVMMLLNLRNAVCDDEEEEPAVRYTTRAVSELPAPAAPKPKTTSKARSNTSDELSWRQPAHSLPTSSAESYVAKHKASNPTDDQKITRAVRSLLNKLTVEKFDSLFEQLTTCGIQEPHHISSLMHEVFEKATTQHHFIPMYAELCVKLEKDPRIVSIVEEAADPSQNFRRLLLNECQSVFESVLESRKEDDADEEATFRRKQRALGNMKLIGHLLVKEMLTSDVFPGCCEELLEKHAECPEALEALVALIMVAAPKFDKSTWTFYRRLQHILSDMGMLTKDKSVAPRLRFLIRDVLDAREAGWPSSPGGGKAAAPSKLDQVAVQQQQDAIADAKAAQDCKNDSKTSNKKKLAPWKKKGDDAEEQASKKAAEVVAAPVVPKGFQVVAFRRALASIFTDLANERNIPASVQRVRQEKVPVEFQADQYVDILTRIVEERRGAVRRTELAFVAGLGAAETSAFDRKECLNGVEMFFRDVYGELCNEVHRLPAIMKSEFMPTMLTVFPAADLNKVVPAGMRK